VTALTTSRLLIHSFYSKLIIVRIHRGKSICRLLRHISCWQAFRFTNINGANDADAAAAAADDDQNLNCLNLLGLENFDECRSESN